MLGTIIGAVLLRQLPTGQDLLGIALVVAGVARHQVPAGGERQDEVDA
jgi:threonine/homoserine efflux transporter RhtA